MADFSTDVLHYLLTNLIVPDWAVRFTTTGDQALLLSAFHAAVPREDRDAKRPKKREVAQGGVLLSAERATAALQGLVELGLLSNAGQDEYVVNYDRILHLVETHVRA